MKSHVKTLLAAIAMVAGPAIALAADSTVQRFVFLADFAADSPIADPATAPSLVRKAADHARAKGFNYGDILWLRSAPGGRPAWDADIEMLKRAGNHPRQLEPFLNARAAALGAAPLSDRSQVIWALQSLSHIDCAATPTWIYVFANGLSAATVAGDDVTGDGVAPGALQGCSLVWVGLGLKGAETLSLSARMRLDHLFRQVSEVAGASHDVLR